MIATATKAAINAYSMAVAPCSSRRKALNIVGSPACAGPLALRRLLGVELALHGVEHAAERVAHRLEGDDASHRNQRGDEAVFDGRRAALVFHELPDHFGLSWWI